MGVETMRAVVCETNVEAQPLRLRLLKEIMAGGGAWSREARALLTLAQERGIALDDETLIYSDVRDLQAMQSHLTVVRH
jgi:hypothetical protein